MIAFTRNSSKVVIAIVTLRIQVNVIGCVAFLALNEESISLALLSHSALAVNISCYARWGDSRVALKMIADFGSCRLRIVIA